MKLSGKIRKNTEKNVCRIEVRLSFWKINVNLCVCHTFKLENSHTTPVQPSFFAFRLFLYVYTGLNYLTFLSLYIVHRGFDLDSVYTVQPRET